MLFSYQAMLLSLKRLQIGRSTYQDPLASLEIYLFSNLFPRPKKPENGVRSFEKTKKTISKFIKNDFCKKCLPCFLCESLDLEVPGAEMSIQKSIKNDLKTSPNKMKLQAS